MTVQEIMERSSSTDKLKVVKYNIIDGEREYLLPQDMIAVKSVAVKDTNDKKYKRIKRLVHDPVIREDTDPE